MRYSKSIESTVPKILIVLILHINTLFYLLKSESVIAYRAWTYDRK